jgi:hypothetical protein
MMIDPVEILKKTKTSGNLLPTGMPTKLPMPSVVPDPVDYQVVGETGTRTLWVVFIVMVISSAVFAGLSYRVPVVCCPRLSA